MRAASVLIPLLTLPALAGCGDSFAELHVQAAGPISRWQEYNPDWRPPAGSESDFDQPGILRLRAVLCTPDGAETSVCGNLEIWDRFGRPIGAPQFPLDPELDHIPGEWIPAGGYASLWVFAGLGCGTWISPAGDDRFTQSPVRLDARQLVVSVPAGSAHALVQPPLYPKFSLGGDATAEPLPQETRTVELLVPTTELLVSIPMPDEEEQYPGWYVPAGSDPVDLRAMKPGAASCMSDSDSPFTYSRVCLVRPEGASFAQYSLGPSRLPSGAGMGDAFVTSVWSFSSFPDFSDTVKSLADGGKIKPPRARAVAVQMRRWDAPFTADSWVAGSLALQITVQDAQTLVSGAADTSLELWCVGIGTREGGDWCEVRPALQIDLKDTTRKNKPWTATAIGLCSGHYILSLTFIGGGESGVEDGRIDLAEFDLAAQDLALDVDCSR